MNLFYRVKVPLFEWKEQRWVAKHLYSDPAFQKLDQALLAGPNPYPLARVFPYGETPLRVFQAIGKRLDLKEDDCFVDLGCGRGRGVFFMAHVFGCKSTGVDLTSSFIARAKRLSVEHGAKRAIFERQDFLDFDFREVSCVYLYGTTYSDERLEALEERMITQLPEGSRIVTVSAPLKRIQCEGNVDVTFTWGKGTVFFHRKSGSMRQG